MISEDLKALPRVLRDFRMTKATMKTLEAILFSILTPGFTANLWTPDDDDVIYSSSAYI
jgi:hypothetical protein